MGSRQEKPQQKQGYVPQGEIWETKLPAEECCYHILLQTLHPCSNTSSSSSVGKFVVVFIEEEQIPLLVGCLKHLVPVVIAITLKTVRAQAAKALSVAANSCSSSSTTIGGVVVLSTIMSTFLGDIRPTKLQIHTVIHVGNIPSQAEFDKRAEVTKKDHTVPQHIHVLPMGQTPKAIRPFSCNKQFSSIVQQRISAARKLYHVSLEGQELNKRRNDTNGGIDDDDGDVDRARGTNKNKRTAAGDDENNDEQRRKGLAGKIAALKQKLMVLLNLPLPGQSASAGASTSASPGASAGAGATGVSSSSAIIPSGDLPGAAAANMYQPLLIQTLCHINHLSYNHPLITISRVTITSHLPLLSIIFILTAIITTFILLLLIIITTGTINNTGGGGVVTPTTTAAQMREKMELLGMVMTTGATQKGADTHRQVTPLLAIANKYIPSYTSPPNKRARTHIVR